MNSSILFVWSILILGIIALVVYFNKKSKKTKEKILLPLHNYAKENDCVISSYDYWDKTLIGLSESGMNKLFFIRKVAENEFKVMINISEIKNSRLVKTIRTAQFNKEAINVIDRIVVAISFVDNSKKDLALEFYNSDYDHLNLSGELQQAEKWTEIIKDKVVNSNREINITKQTTFPTLNQLHAKAGML